MTNTKTRHVQVRATLDKNVGQENCCNYCWESWPCDTIIEADRANKTKHAEMLDEFGNYRCICGDDWPCDTIIEADTADKAEAALAETVEQYRVMVQNWADAIASANVARADAERLDKALRDFLETRRQAPYLRQDDWDRLDDALAAHEAQNG